MKTKDEAFFEYLKNSREPKPVEYTCQHKGGINEKFCRATQQKTCEGCRFYEMGIWAAYDRAFDLLAAKDKKISELELENQYLKATR